MAHQTRESREMAEVAVREVWRGDVVDEIGSLRQFLWRYPCTAAIDTEFPGFAFATARNASAENRYADLKANVDSMKPIQVGITLADFEGTNHCCWQFNLSGFDPNLDRHSPESVQLLRRSGIDIERVRDEGVFPVDFGSAMRMLLKTSRDLGINWITFHGLYDIAYLFKLVTALPLPNTAEEFVNLAGALFGVVYDVKHLARQCPIGGEVGLAHLARFLLGEEAVGHRNLQVGFRSYLTSCVFHSMKRHLPLGSQQDTTGLQGILYGLETVGRIGASLPSMIPLPMNVDEGEDRLRLQGSPLCHLLELAPHLSSACRNIAVGPRRLRSLPPGRSPVPNSLFPQHPVPFPVPKRTV